MVGTQEKFQTLLEDIFEAANSLPADPDSDSLSSNPFFDRLGRDNKTPLLATDIVEKITRYILRLNSSKRSSDNAWDEESLKRVFRLLERSMRDAEDVDPFQADKKAGESKAKKGVKKGKKGAKSPPIEESQGESQETVTGVDPEEVERYETLLRVAAAGMRAVECCLAILDCEGLSKPVSAACTAEREG